MTRFPQFSPAMDGRVTDVKKVGFLRRTISSAVILLVICVLSITTAILIGYGNPAPSRMATWHLSDCPLPCWIGIRPGITTIHDAKEQIKRIYRNGPGYALIPNAAGFTVQETINDGERTERFYFNIECDPRNADEDSVVTTIGLGGFEPTGHDPQIGDLEGILGPPAYVSSRYSDMQSTSPILIYPKHQVTVWLDESPTCGNISPVQAAPGIIIYAQMHQLDDWLIRPQIWRGFNRCNDLFERNTS